MRPFAVAIAGALLLASTGAPAQEREPIGSVVPPVARDIDLEEHLGAEAGVALSFTDPDGRRVRLSDYLGDGRPVLLVLAYYRCPMLCGLVLRGVVEGLRQLDWRLGEQYRVVTVSFDPRDTTDAARRKQAGALAALGRPEQTMDWPFLVGDEPDVRALADTVGFRYAYDADSDLYAHPAAVVVLTPDGRISRYLYGTGFSARDLRLGLLEASQGKVGTIVDRVLLTCYRYDPAARRFEPYILGFMRLGAVAILGVVLTMLAVLWSRERGRTRSS